VTDERGAQAGGENFEELEVRAGGFGRQFTTYEEGIGRRFEALSTQIAGMNRLLAGIHAYMRCMTFMLIAAALAAAVIAVLVLTGWFGFAPAPD